MAHIKNKLLHQQQKIKNLATRIFKGKSLVLSQHTPYDIILTYKFAKVRYYASSERKYKEPLVFVSPLAVNMAIYDLFPYRSLIQYFQNSGFDVYLIEWQHFRYADRFINFLSFIDDAIPYCVNQICIHAQSSQISLHGWSMGGVFVTLYTALHQPKQVKNLLVMGAPIDSYASGKVGKIFQRTNQIITHSTRIQDAIYSGLIPKHLIHTPGFINALGFKILDPQGWLKSQQQLLKHLGHMNHLYEHATMGHFLNHMIDYPGGINQDMVFNVWLQNPLKQGEIQLNDKLIKLKDIQCSLLIGAGSHDQIVTASAAKPLSRLTNSTDVTFTLIPGGHLGLMSSQNSAHVFWPEMAQWLIQRSHTLDNIN